MFVFVEEAFVVVESFLSLLEVVLEALVGLAADVGDRLSILLEKLL